MQGLIFATDMTTGQIRACLDRYNLNAHFYTFKLDTADLLPVDLSLVEMGCYEIEQLNHIKKITKYLILIGDSEKDALEAWKIGATGFLLKPFQCNELYAQVLHCVQAPKKNNSTKQAEGFFLKSEGKWIHIRPEKIRFIQAMGDYIRIFIDGAKSIMVNKTMKHILKELPPDSFFRVHRSYIINKSFIDYIEDHTVILGAEVIPISESYKKEFMESLRIV